MDNPYAGIPWAADPVDRDEEGFRVIRGVDGRPVAFVSRWLSANQQEDVARLIMHSPVLLAAMRKVFYASSGTVDWSEKEWQQWRAIAGPALADLWPVDEK